jgi:hypothetical protein
MAYKSLGIIEIYFAITVVPFGLILNIVSFFIFIRKRLNRNVIFGYLYAWLCLFDALSLSNEMVFGVLAIYKIDPTSYSELTCKTVYGWAMYVKHLPSFQMVLIAYYLYLNICTPRKKELIHRHKLTLVMSMVGFVTLVNLLYIFYGKEVGEIGENASFANASNVTLDIHFKNDCTTLTQIDFFLDMTNLSMRDFIPFTLIFILNYLTIRGFIESRQAVSNRSQHRENKFMYSIIGSNLIFLLIYLPWAVVFFIYHLNDSFFILAHVIESDTFETVVQLFECLAYVNNMTCFFLNLVFNSHFLNELLIVFRMRPDEGSITIMNRYER